MSFFETEQASPLIIKDIRRKVLNSFLTISFID